jgi:hypothetical protein
MAPIRRGAPRAAKKLAIHASFFGLTMSRGKSRSLRTNTSCEYFFLCSVLAFQSTIHPSRCSLFFIFNFEGETNNILDGLDFTRFSLLNLRFIFILWLFSDLMLQRQAFTRGGVSDAAMELAALPSR